MIEVEINSKFYNIRCAPEDEEPIKEYITILKNRIENNKKKDPLFFANTSNETVFLFQALALISEAKQENVDNNSQEEDLDALSARIDNLYKRVLAIYEDCT